MKRTTLKTTTNPTFPLDIAPAYQCRWVNKDQESVLINYYHLARVPLSGTGHDDKYHRMVQAAKWFHQQFPAVSESAAYKDLDGLLS